MQENPKISIIIPVYNAEAYLHRCVDSVLSQKFKDFELLLVDDGSVDSSADICDKYAICDERVRVFHKKNGGVSSARNLGLDNARGEWVVFVDADDWVDVDYLANLYSGDNYDLVASYYTAEGWKEWVSVPFKDCIYEKYEMKEFLSLCLLDFIYPFGKLFRYSIIKMHNLRFNIDISYGEDTLFIYQFIKYIGSVKTVSKATYHYNCYSIGLSKQKLNWDAYWTVLEKLLETIQDLEYVFTWNGRFVYNKTAVIFFQRYIYQISTNNTLFNIRKELKTLLNNPILRNSIKEQINMTWKWRVFCCFMFCGFLWGAALILVLKNKKR